MTISGSGSHRRPPLSPLAGRTLLRPGRPQRTPRPQLRRGPDRRRRRPPHQDRCPQCRPGCLPRRPSRPARNLNTPANADRTGVSREGKPGARRATPFRAAPLAGDWQTVRNDAGSGPIVKRIASTVALTLAAAAGAGSAAAPPALAGALPAAPGVTGISAPGPATRAPQLVRAPTGGEPQAPAVPGAQLWVRRYNGPGNNLGNDDVARSVAVSPDGTTVYVTGYSQGTISDEYATIAYNTATGARLWVSRYNDPSNYGAEANSVAVSPDADTVFVTGSDNAASNGDDYVTGAYNAATGATQWVRRYNGPGNGVDQAYAVAVSPGGGTVYITGASIGSAGAWDDATIAYSAATGATRWLRRYSSSYGTSQGHALAVSPGGGTVYVTGFSVGGASEEDYRTVAYNAVTGARRWARRYNGPGNGTDEASSVAVSPGGTTVYVTGYSPGATSGDDYATVAYNAATGATRWVQRYGSGGGASQASAVAVSPTTGTVFITGYSTSLTSGEDYLTIAYSG